MEHDTPQTVPADQPHTPPPAPHHTAQHPHTHQTEPVSAIGQLKPIHQIEIDELDLSSRPAQPHTGRTVAAAIMSLAIVVGLAATWYHFNRSVYSLEGQAPPVTADNSLSTPTPATLGAETSQPGPLSFDFAHLKPLSQGHYQAWLKHQDQVTALGAFKIADDGTAQTLDNNPFTPTAAATDNDQLLVSIEAGDDIASSPSATIILTGTVKQGKVSLSFGAINLAQASGTFILSTPTDPAVDAKSGLWFAKTDGQALTGPSLTLPAAPAGWKYEGQAVYKDIAVEIGRFSSPTQADEFNKFTTNPDKTPAFPGEDFLKKAPSQLGIDFPTNLASGDWQVIISIEPDQDGTDPTGNDTFFMQPLKATIAADSQPNKEYALTLDTSSLPTGTATFK